MISCPLDPVVENLPIGDNNLVLEAKAGEPIRCQQGIVKDRLRMVMAIIIQLVRIRMGLLINKIIFSIFMQVQELRNQS